ncbi:hypothetical protein Tco_0080118 [Tanacetum coccineum]
MSQEKEAQKKFHKTREDKELEKIIALEDKIKVLDDIVYKTGQSVQTMNMLNRNCKTSFVKTWSSQNAQRANPVLPHATKLSEYEIWRMRMEQYIQMIDYSLWEVIENGNVPLITKVVKGVETTIAPTIAEEKAQRRRGLEGMLLLKDSEESSKAALKIHGEVSNRRCESEVLKKSVTIMEHTYHEFTSKPIVIKPIVENSEAKDVKQSLYCSLGRIMMLRIIRDWASDSVEENVSQTKIEKKIAKLSFVKIHFVKAKQTNKTDRKTAKQVEHNRQNIQIPRGNQQNWNYLMSQKLGRNFEMINKACYVYGSFETAAGSMSYLIDYKEIDGGYVAFGGNLKGGKLQENVPLKLLVVIGNQSNGNVGTKACDDACKASMETDLAKITFCYHCGLLIYHSLKVQRILLMMDPNLQVMMVRSINEVNTIGAKTSIKLPDDQNMLELEDIVYLYDDEDVGTEANMNNLDAFILVSSISNLKNTTKIIQKRYYNQGTCSLDLVDLPKNKGALALIVGCERDFSLCVKIEENHVCQPPGFEDPDFPNRVYKVEKALYGLHQAHRAWTASKVEEDGIFYQSDKSVMRFEEILVLLDVQTARHLWKSNAFAQVCACARYQVNPKVSHLHAVKRIFRYLKGQPKLGLLYLKDSPFDLVAYTDSDYARASLDWKSTTGDC